MIIGVDARVLTQKELRGISNYVIEIIKAWPDKKDKFIFFYEDGEIYKDLYFSTNEIRWIRVPEPHGTRFKVWYWVAMPKTLKDIHLDILWCPANVPIPFINQKQILTIHDTILQEPFMKHNFFDAFFYKLIVPFFTRQFVDQVITVSKFSKERINRIFNFPLRRIKVIYNGAPTYTVTDGSSEEAKKVLSDNGINVSRFIYALGAASLWKNTKILIQVFPLLLKEEPELHLIISGLQEEVMSRYRNILRQMNLESKVHLLGFVSTSLRNALYQTSQLFVYPSLFEGFGLPPLEAMSMGCPVVASNRASIPEVVGDAALLVDCSSLPALAEAILKLLKDSRLKNKLIRRGYNNLLRFNWKESAQSHRNVFLNA